MNQSLRLSKEIIVQQYVFGQPFPDLLSEIENLPALPEHSLTMPGLLSSGMTGKFGVVMTREQGIQLVKDGEYMQISEPSGGLNRPTCLGLVPIGYKEVYSLYDIGVTELLDQRK